MKAMIHISVNQIPDYRQDSHTLEITVILRQGFFLHILRTIAHGGHVLCLKLTVSI